MLLSLSVYLYVARLRQNKYQLSLTDPRPIDACYPRPSSAAISPMNQEVDFLFLSQECNERKFTEAPGDSVVDHRRRECRAHELRSCFHCRRSRQLMLFDSTRRTSLSIHFTHSTHHRRPIAYLSEHCVPVLSADTRRHLRSANRHLYLPYPNLCFVCMGLVA